MKRISKLFIITFLLITSHCFCFATTYNTYVNGRYGFTIDYPSNFIMQKPPANGDGLTFISPDGQFTLTAAGSNSIGPDYYLDYYDKVADKASYRAKGDNWFIISWLEDGKIYYQKTFFGTGSSNSLYLTYSASQKEQYDEIIVNLEKSFKHGDLERMH